MSRRSYKLYRVPRQWAFNDQFGPEDPAWPDDEPEDGDEEQEPEYEPPSQLGDHWTDYGGEG